MDRNKCLRLDENDKKQWQNTKWHYPLIFIQIFWVLKQANKQRLIRKIKSYHGNFGLTGLFFDY